MRPNPLMIHDRMTALGGAAMMACIVFVVGYAIHKAISKGSDSKRIQGGPIVWWVTVLYFSGACLGAWCADNKRYYLNEVVGGMGGFGLLVGLAIGNIHGILDLRRARRVPFEASEIPTDAIPHTQAPNDNNPYAPPRQP